MSLKRTKLFSVCLCVLLFLTACSAGMEKPSEAGSGTITSDAALPEISDLLHGDVSSIYIWSFGKHATTEDPEKIAEIMELVEQIRFEPCTLEEADRPGAQDAVIELSFADGRSLSLSLPVAVFSDGDTQSAFRAYIGDQKANELLPGPESLGA